MKDIVARKKVAYKKEFGFPSKYNKSQYKRIRNQTRKVVARAISKASEQNVE